MKCNVYGQFSLSYYLSGNGQNKIGFGYNFSKTIWAEYRTCGDTRTYLTTSNHYETFRLSNNEIALLFNVAKRERHNFYTGISLQKVDPIGTYLSLPLGLKFLPIENFKRLSLQIEFKPGFKYDDIWNVYCQSSFGIRYTFKDN